MKTKGPNGDGWQTVTPKEGVPLYLCQSDMPPREEWIPHINAWIPIYLEGIGNTCEVTMADGQQAYFGMGAPRILQMIADYYAVDMNSMRDWYRDFVIKSQWPPLVVASRDAAFFAIKTRRPRQKNDGATGYVADIAIDAVEALTAHTTRIHLKQGDPVDVLESKRCVMSRRNHATSFKRQLANDGIIPRV